MWIHADRLNARREQLQDPFATADVSETSRQFSAKYPGSFETAGTGASLRAAIWIGLAGPVLVGAYGH